MQTERSLGECQNCGQTVRWNAKWCDKSCRMHYEMRTAVAPDTLAQEQTLQDRTATLEEVLAEQGIEQPGPKDFYECGVNDERARIAAYLRSSQCGEWFDAANCIEEGQHA